MTWTVLVAAGLLSWGCAGHDSASVSSPGLIAVGGARVDITPVHPLRLSGYGSRATPSEGVEQKLWARALVLGDRNPVAVVTVDSIAVPGRIAEAAAKELRKSFGIPRDRVVMASTHSHTAPHPSRDCLPTIFRVPPTEEEWKQIDRYGSRMQAGIVTAVAQALAARKPCRVSWAQGKAGFAINRRKMENGKWVGFGETPDGAVDHALPVLAARDEAGKVVAVLANYACHCTTLGGGFNKTCGDWAGYAVEGMERDHEGAVGLVMIGCGADANPKNRGTLSVAKEHGAELAGEVKRLLSGRMTPLQGLPETKFRFVELPLEKAPSRAELEKFAREDKRQQGQRARRFLKILDTGAPLPRTVSLPVQTWRFGDDVAMVFLGGEVVVDYALRLKETYGARRLWVSAYCNDVPCYIPSVRILREGGYEADRSMVYYAKPAPFKPEVERTLLGAIGEMLPSHWR